MISYAISNTRSSERSREELIRLINSAREDLRIVCSNQDYIMSLKFLDSRESIKSIGNFLKNYGRKLELLLYADKGKEEISKMHLINSLSGHKGVQIALLPASPKIHYMVSDKQIAAVKDDCSDRYGDLNIFKNSKIAGEWLERFEKMMGMAVKYKN